MNLADRLVTGHVVEWTDIHWHIATIWPKVYTYYFHSCNRCTSRDHWVAGSTTYHGWLSMLGPPDSPICERALETTLTCCQKLGVLVVGHKTEGPSTSLVFLGIELDTEVRAIWLLDDKLHKMQGGIKSWAGKHSHKKRALLSLIGQLQQACHVVQPGRTFLRRMINLSTTAKELYHRIRLNRGFRSDLYWWARFLPKWNGVGMMTGVVRRLVFETVTSGSWEYGAYLASGT